MSAAGRGARGGTDRWGGSRGVANGVPDPRLPLRRAKAALGLERQIQDADRVLRGFESALAQEAPLPAGPGALQERVVELQVSGQSPDTLRGEVASG